jgi:hypothetical protein
MPRYSKFMTTRVLQREYRRIWFWRHCPLLFTIFVCFFLGGVVSEFVQSLLPVRLSLSLFLLFFNSDTSLSAQYKTFQFGDIVVRFPLSLPFALLTLSDEKANLLGSGIGLYVAYHLERYYRQRREVCPPFFPSEKR